MVEAINLMYNSYRFSTDQISLNLAMNQELLAKNKVALEAEKARITKLLSKVASPEAKQADEYAPKFPNEGDTIEDNTLEVEEFQVNISEEATLTDRMDKIKAALGRIENGTYGKCLVGGEEIDEKRLTAAPEADTCVAHART